MRNTYWALLVVGMVGCGHGIPGPGDDMGTDMSVRDDVSWGDMLIPDDAQKLVTFTQFALDFAKELCAHYTKCGMLDAAQTDACVESNLKHLGWDEDVEIMKGRVSVNELQHLPAPAASGQRRRLPRRRRVHERLLQAQRQRRRRRRRHAGHRLPGRVR